MKCLKLYYNKVLILERRFSRFNPKKYIDKDISFQAFEAKTIEREFYSWPKPDILIL